jgi:hypothetical protein
MLSKVAKAMSLRFCGAFRLVLLPRNMQKRRKNPHAAACLGMAAIGSIKIPMGAARGIFWAKTDQLS